MLVLVTALASALCVPVAPRKVTEILPLKSAMLMKSWQGMLAEVDQKVGVVPELGSTSVGVKRFGPELERRTFCKRQFERFYESAYGLAIADKSQYPAAKRELLESLHIGGSKRGPDCAVFASLTSPASMVIVERLDSQWNVLALCLNPSERKMETIVEAERATLAELRSLAAAAADSEGGEGGGAELRVLADVKQTLAGSCEQLDLTPLGDGDFWWRCEA